jgi:hypothetical protein
VQFGCEYFRDLHLGHRMNRSAKPPAKIPQGCKVLTTVAAVFEVLEHIVIGLDE